MTPNFCLFNSPVRGLTIKAGLENVSDLWVTTISIIVVIMYTVALHVTNSILSLPVVAGPQSKAVSPIMARPWVVTLRVTSVVPNLFNSTVAEDKVLSEAGVLHRVHTQVKGNVVRTQSLSKSLVLELDLGFRHGGVSTIIIRKVNDSVANTLRATELPVVVIACDYVSVITSCEATGWRQEWGDDFLFRDGSSDDCWMEANFAWGP